MIRYFLLASVGVAAWMTYTLAQPQPQLPQPQVSQAGRAQVSPTHPPTKTAAVDVTKRRIEDVPTTLVANSAVANPKVKPGSVRWHANFDAACAAAKQSGKPVLLFQLMGKLDDRFC